MTNIVVAGLINIETTIQVGSFPIDYTPVRYPFFGVNTTVSGVGYNVAKALTVLGDRVDLLALVGSDPLSTLVRDTLRADGIPIDRAISQLPQTPCSAILYDTQGRRAIHVDLKDIQEQAYPLIHFETALADAELAVLCNINFARPFLDLAKAAHKPIATDVHAIAHLDDDYNRDFMRSATILAQSDEKLSMAPEEWVRHLWDRWGTPIAIVGLGASGALLAVRDDHFVERIPSTTTRPVVNTIGAGDALFSAFVHFYAKSGDPYDAMRKAQIFASYKIGESGGAAGFLNEREVEAWFMKRS